MTKTSRREEWLRRRRRTGTALLILGSLLASSQVFRTWGSPAAIILGVVLAGYGFALVTTERSLPL